MVPLDPSFPSSHPVAPAGPRPPRMRWPASGSRPQEARTGRKPAHPARMAVEQPSSKQRQRLPRVEIWEEHCQAPQLSPGRLLPSPAPSPSPALSDRDRLNVYQHISEVLAGHLLKQSPTKGDRLTVKRPCVRAGCVEDHLHTSHSMKTGTVELQARLRIGRIADHVHRSIQNKHRNIQNPIHLRRRTKTRRTVMTLDLTVPESSTTAGS